MPAEAAGRFHHQALAAGGRQHALPVRGVLLLEQFHAGHRHHPHVLAFAAQLGGGLGAELQLGAGADQDQIRRAVAVFKDVATLGHCGGAGVGLVGHRLTAEDQHGGALAIGHGHLVGTAGFVAIAGADHQHVGDRAQAGQGLDRLVGGAVFTQADRVVGEHVDHAQLTQGREAHATHHVAREHGKGAAVRNQAAAVIGEAIEDRRHGVFAHAEVQVTVGLGAFLETLLPLDVSEVGVGEVGRAADQLGQVGADRVEAVVGVLAGGQALVVGAIGRQVGIPALGQLTTQASLEFSGVGRVLGAIVGQRVVPVGLGSGTAADRLAPVVVGLLGHLEGAVAPAQVLAGQVGFLGSQGGTVHAGGVGLVGGAVADGGGHLDHRGAVGDRLGLGDGPGDGLHVGVAIGHVDGVPAVGLVALQHILRERHVGVAVDGDVVVVVEGNQFAQAQVASQRGGLAAHALLVAAVAHDHVGVVINDRAVGLVELGGQVGFSHGQTHGIGDALTQGAGGDFHARGLEGFGVTGSLGAPLAELLDVLDGHRVVAAQVQQRIQQHAAVASREHEAVAVEPLGVLGVVLQNPIPQGKRHRRAAHGQAGVAGIALVDRIHCQEADAVDAEVLHAAGGGGGAGGGNHGGIGGRGGWV